MEEFLIEDLTTILASHGKKDVSSNKLMDYFALCRDALEDHVFSIPKLDHHVAGLPVHIPGLDKSNSP